MAAPVDKMTGPHVVGLFATREQAESALDSLLAADFTSDDVSVVTAEGQEVSFPTAREEGYDTGMRNTAIGAGIGAVAGFLILGPLFLLAGTVAGGLVGLLLSLGASREQAESIAEQVGSGHYLVAAHAGEREPQATAILESAGATNVHHVSG